MHPRYRHSPLVLLGLALGLAGCAQSSVLPDEGLLDAEPASIFAAEGDVDPWHPSVVRARAVQITVDLAAGSASPFDAEPVVDDLRLPLFEDAVYEAHLTRVTRSGRGVVWEGRVAGADPSTSEAILASVGGRVAGTVRVDGRLFSILPRPDHHLIVEWDESSVPQDAEPPQPQRIAADVAAAAEEAGQAGGSRRSTTASAGDGAVKLDVLVAYTETARRRGGGVDAMEALITLAAAETNAGFEASGLPIRLNVVGTPEVAYDEAGFDYEQTLGRAAWPSDGQLDELPALRDELGADHVVLIVDSVTRYAGIGYQMTYANAGYFAQAAYSVVARDYAAGNHTFAHELGHNLGAHHDPANAGPAYFEDSRGHQDPEQGFRTVMSYGCSSASCPRVNRWSDPAADIAGHPAGVDGVSHNARALLETGPIAAAFRSPRVEPPEPTVARIVVPTAGARLDDGAVTFRWTEVQADAYYLMIGRSPGDDSYFRLHAGTATQTVVEGLPRGGQALHARIWTLAEGRWRYSDHRFEAFDGGFEGAALSVPADGSTLPSTWSWFGWRGVEGAGAYRLQVGTEQEPSRFFDRTYEVDVSRRSATQWALVPGLPADGSRVVARLSTRSASGWVLTEARYAGYKAPAYAAVLTSPATDSTLPSGPVTFGWSRTAATDHWLVIRDGRRVLAARTSFGGTSVRIEGLPEDGRALVAVLYSRGPDGSWTSTTAGYRAAR